MSRIQVLPLPTIRNGEAERTPFIIVIDQVDADADEWPTPVLDWLKVHTSADAVIVHDGTLDAPGSLDLTEDEKAQLLHHLTHPQQWISNPTYTDSSAPLTPGPSCVHLITP